MAANSKLEHRLGYVFTDPDLLARALTHRSHQDLNYERLEFLGDSILSFAIAEYLYHRFPEAREGQLSRLRARIVRRETLAEVAREFGLGDFLIMGSGELRAVALNGPLYCLMFLKPSSVASTWRQVLQRL